MFLLHIGHLGVFPFLWHCQILMNFKKWFDVPVLEVELTRMPNLKQALKG